jgi:hypothetical protein
VLESLNILTLLAVVLVLAWMLLKYERQLTLHDMKTDEAVAKMEKAIADQAEANTEIRGKFDVLNARILELEELVRNGDVPAALAAKIELVATGAKELADVIPNPPAAAQT